MICNESFLCPQFGAIFNTDTEWPNTEIYNQLSSFPTVSIRVCSPNHKSNKIAICKSQAILVIMLNFSHKLCQWKENT